MTHLIVTLLTTLKDNPDALMFALLLAFLSFLATLATASVRRSAEPVRGSPPRRGKGPLGKKRGQKK